MEEKKVHEYGFIRLVDIMGDDGSIVQAARTSTGLGITTPERDAKLIDYLLRNNHTSPFEMVDTKWHIKVPIFIARQWLRHRTASVNELSGRYSELPNEFYIPDVLKTQGKMNKQGSSDPIPDELNQQLLLEMENQFKTNYELYEKMLKFGVSREQARIVLPVALYTEFYWKINLHNLFNFIKLRMDDNAQQEIHEYSNIIFDILKEKVPVACLSFEKHILKKED